MRRLAYSLRILLLVVALMAASSAAWAQNSGWQMLSTPHFTFYALPENEGVMRTVAEIAEEVRPLVNAYVGYEPVERIHVVILDSGDLFNGMAISEFYNRIIILPVHPLNSIAYSSGLGPRVDNPLRTVFIHEYTHIVQADMPGNGLSAFIRRVFGRAPGYSTPNITQPPLSAEGLAVRAETLFTTAGRGRDPLYDMFLRTAVLDDKLLRLDQALGFYMDAWDPAGAPYLYGTALADYIAEKYGPESLQIANRYYANAFGSWGMAIKVATGVELNTIWADWMQVTTAKYQEQAAQIKESGLTALQPVADTGDLDLTPAYSPDGRYMAYTVAAGAPAGVYLRDTKTGKTQRLVDGIAYISGKVSWAPDGLALVYSRVNDNGIDILTTDVYKYNVASHTEQRLTHGLRAYSPTFTPNGQDVLFVARPDPVHANFMMVAADGGEPRPLNWRLPADLLPLSAEYALSGEQLVLSGWLPGGYTDLYLVDVERGSAERLTADRAVDTNPVWSTDGRYILFDSDRSGVYNIYALDPAARELRQVTNTLTGVFAPTITQEGNKLAVMEYTAEGYRISTLAYNPHLWRPVAATLVDEQPASSATQPAPSATQPASPAATTALQPYRPWSTLAPKYWLPYFNADENGYQVGVLTSGADALDHTRYSALVGVGLANRRVGYELALRHIFGTHSQWTLAALAADMPAMTTQGIKRQQEQQVSIAYTWGGVYRTHQLQASVTNVLAPNSTNSSTSATIQPQYAMALRTQSLSGAGSRQQQSMSLWTVARTAGQSDGVLSYLRQDRFATRRDYFDVAIGAAVAESAGKLTIGGNVSQFGVRGSNIMAAGKTAWSASAQYSRRVPLGAGIGDRPLFFEEISVGPFIDIAGSQLPAGPLVVTSIGLELGLSMVVGYAAPCELHLGVAVPLQDEYNAKLYAGFQAPL